MSSSTTEPRDRNMLGMLILGLALVLALLAGLCGGYGLGVYRTNATAEKEMRKHLQAATPQQAAPLKAQASKSGNPFFMLAAERVYIATGNVTLVEAESPMTIVLPEGKRWSGGPQKNVILLRVYGTTPDQIKHSFPVTDPACAGEYNGLSYKSCGNPTFDRSAKPEDMTRDMRRPSVQELKLWLGAEYDKSDDPTEYWVATTNFVTAPDYTPSNLHHTVGIFMLPGTTWLGGQLGYMSLMRVSVTGPTGRIVEDQMCQNNGGDVVFAKNAPADRAGKTNIAHPATFAPAEAQKRVSACQR